MRRALPALLAALALLALAPAAHAAALHPAASPVALDWDGVRPSSAAARAARDSLLLSPEDRRAHRAGGTWSELFDGGAPTSGLPVLLWVAALVAVGLIGLPYVWLAASGLPDRGYALARPVGLLLLGWAVWWLASVEATTFSRGAIALVGALAAAGGAAIAVWRRRELAVWLRRSWRLLAVEEVIFWTIFAAVLAVRWANPDLWHPTLGGEKPMDLAFLNAVVKSTEFPPYDPWFAGGYLNYYYFGFVLVAVLVKATAIVPYVAYNLAIPSLAALLALGSFGVTLALVAGSGKVPRRAAPVAAVLAAVFVVVIGNLGELEVVIDALQGSIPIEWWYWNASRAISTPSGEPGPITEFPAFTFLYADLHAHAMALPFTVTALGLALAYLWRQERDGWAAAAARFVLLALAVGALWPLNTWDFPTYAALALVVLALAAWGTGARSLARTALLGGAVLAASYLLFLPFHEHYRSAFSGIERWRGSRTSIADYLTVHGFFLFLIASALVLDLWLSRDLSPAARLLRLLLRRRRPRRLLRLHRALVRRPAGSGLGLAAAGFGWLLAVGLAAAGNGVPALIVALLTLAGLLFVRRPRRDVAGQRRWQLTLVLVIAGLLITLAVEFVVVEAIDIGRTNTVFKSYLQVWVLWAIAGAVGLHLVYERLRRFPRPFQLAWLGAFAALFAITLLYPILATRAKIDHRFDPSVGGTLDGTAFMRRAVHVDRDRRLPLRYDREAIRWMQEHVHGSPVVAEVNTYPTLYGWGNRYAMFTGNPSVVGWDFHERQQRPDHADDVLARIEAVQEAYRTTDPDRAYRLLRRYGADYLVVGPLERAYFPAGQRKWRTRAGSLWELVYRNPGVEIYRLRIRGSPGASPSRRTAHG